jgi:hypothetical protein
MGEGRESWARVFRLWQREVEVLAAVSAAREEVLAAVLVAAREETEASVVGNNRLLGS